MEKEWLSLSGAAKILGVHPGTLRKWSDDGKLPVHLTSGGHRRYRFAEVKDWQEKKGGKTPFEIDDLLDQVLLTVRTHMQNEPMENQNWYSALDQETRDHYRASGRILAHAILFQLAASDFDPLVQARIVGSDYALRSRKHNLSAVDATRAFIFFRSLVLDAILIAYQAHNPSSPEAWANMLRRFHRFTDQILLAILIAYEERQE
jgi:excisionase family DNA binding protein